MSSSTFRSHALANYLRIPPGNWGLIALQQKFVVKEALRLLFSGILIFNLLLQRIKMTAVRYRSTFEQIRTSFRIHLFSCSSVCRVVLKVVYCWRCWRPDRHKPVPMYGMEILTISFSLLILFLKNSSLLTDAVDTTFNFTVHIITYRKCYIH